MNKSILFLVNVDWFFVSHRLPIALAAIKAGYEVHLACGVTDKSEYLSSLGIRVHPLPLSRGGTVVFAELKSIYSIYKIIRLVRPDLIHYITIKPVLYGGICSRLLGVKARVASISGLGYVFISKGLKAGLFRRGISLLYSCAFDRRYTKVIFQNPDDRDALIKTNAIAYDQTVIIKGSGVPLREYSYKPEPDGIPVVAMASRLLKDKGVCEFVDAAEILHKRGCKAKFQLVGDIDLHNPATVTQDEIDAWASAGIVNITGFCSDIAGLFASSNIVVLPSYREGLPKVLCEAAACGRAVVTTDVPGCRDAVEPGVTGLLVPVRDSVALADAIQELIDNPALRRSMGKAGRDLAEREFSIDKVVQRHMEIYREFIHE